MSWKNLSLRAKLVLGFGFSVIILLIIAGMALYDTSRLTELTAARATARQFLWNLEQLVSLTRSAENDARGFMLTGDQHFIATFDDDTKKVPALFADLEKGDPAQREALHGLRPIVDAKIASLQMLIERRRQEGLKPLLLDAAALAGDEHITALRSESTRIRNNEQVVLNDRGTSAHPHRRERGAARPLAQTDAAQRGCHRGHGETAPRHPHHRQAGRGSQRADRGLRRPHGRAARAHAPDARQRGDALRLG